MVNNFEMAVYSVDGTATPTITFKNTAEIIRQIYTDDFAAPPANVVLTVKDENGVIVDIVIPYGEYDKVKVKITDPKI